MRAIDVLLAVTDVHHLFCHQLGSWVLEGSLAFVDSHNDNLDLNNSHVTRNFAISTPPSGAFRFVRLRQTGRNHKGNNYLAFCALKLFGALSRE